jgi:hypothetical protein
LAFLLFFEDEEPVEPEEPPPVTAPGCGELGRPLESREVKTDNSVGASLTDYYPVVWILKNPEETKEKLRSEREKDNGQAWLLIELLIQVISPISYSA